MATIATRPTGVEKRVDDLTEYQPYRSESYLARVRIFADGQRAIVLVTPHGEEGEPIEGAAKLAALVLIDNPWLRELLERPRRAARPRPLTWLFVRRGELLDPVAPRLYVDEVLFADYRVRPRAPWEGPFARTIGRVRSVDFVDWTTVEAWVGEPLA